jgi:hypothetical protein
MKQLRMIKKMNSFLNFKILLKLKINNYIFNIMHCVYIFEINIISIYIFEINLIISISQK